MRRIVVLLAAVITCVNVISAHEKIFYSGKVLSNPDYHDGQLSPVIGVHNIQVMRANRENPSKANGYGWTYNHQPMLAYWEGRFFLQYLSNPVGESVPPGRTLICESKDGYNWDEPKIVFPEYKVPDGFTKDTVRYAKNLIAVTHQRMGFYVSNSGKLLTVGYYGISFDKKGHPNDGNGIGRVVREIKKNGKFGPVYFVRYNHGFSEKNTDYPFYKTSKDKDFVKACDEMLSNPLITMQWVEESDADDPIIPLHKRYKAFNYYTLPDSSVACLWKEGLTSISEDGGRTWQEPVLRAQGFVTHNAKIWGQRLTDGSYATVYNPSEFRWPLAISLSADGLDYKTLNLVNGEISPMRYGGNYKAYGPQYTRGIQEGNGTPPDSGMWVTYSMNKEDIWISNIPVPVRLKATSYPQYDFSKYKNISELKDMNIYSPVWAPVKIEKKKGISWLTLKDKDRYDYAKVEQIIPETRALDFSFDFMAGQNDNGTFKIEFKDKNGISCSRIDFTSEGYIGLKDGYRFKNMEKYVPGKIYHLNIKIDVANRNIKVFDDGNEICLRMLYAPVHSIDRIVFYTGDRRFFPTPETPTDQDYDLKNGGIPVKEAVYRIANLKTGSYENENTAAVLTCDDLSRYVDYFNNMEDENIVAAIPNSKSAKWMEENIPLFDCPQQNFEEMYYYRWWSLRKHIEMTSVGYAMTEFLVRRSYADKYNLIACAVGHHIYESRWIRTQKFLDQIINTWYRGNKGKVMRKKYKFSSWMPDAIYNRYLVNMDTSFILKYLPDMEMEYKHWDNTHRLKSGLYWQEDVKDGMEESISGGRRKKYARPTINSYMYGNAVSLSKMELLAGNKKASKFYIKKADTIQNLVETKLWNKKSGFFETFKNDTLANVREAIGFIPWYFNLPKGDKYDEAWKQVDDENGFSAPFGLTTAERRHPEFRTHGVGKCEWDGAIWPFATSQTLTAMANLMNNYDQKVVTDSIYFKQMNRYVESQYYRGRPYIGEYLDEVTGYWLKGDQERSRYYNHSTFEDLIITGLMGLRPRNDDILEVNPLIPQDVWNWFCLDNVLYHNHNITILWDKDGDRYHLGKGFMVMVDGKIVVRKDSISRVKYKMYE